MKKILFCLLSLVLSVYVVNADEVKSENLPYYVLLNDEFIQVKKIVDRNNNVLFNIDYKKYNTNNNFKKYDKYEKSIFIKTENAFNKFKTIAYYGYNEEPNDLNYYLTQVLIWQIIGGYRISLVDENKNEISEYKALYKKLNNKNNDHYRSPTFSNKNIELEIWDNINFEYINRKLIYDNPINKNINITNNGYKINFYANKVSNNKLIFYKKYENIAYCYSDGNNYYWQSLGGPEDLEASVNIDVFGTKFKIKENLIGINDNTGDASINSVYELYLDNELKTTFSGNEEIYVKSNSKYILKDISTSPSTINREDLILEIKDEDYVLNIDKYVVSKNISFEILDNNTYYIYLKSNNKLYNKVNKETNLITLPYGIYYITDNKNYYEEIVVDNSIDELIKIDNSVKENIVMDKENNLLKEMLDSNIINEVENPKTIDNIYFYLISCFISILLIYLNTKYIQNI